MSRRKRFSAAIAIEGNVFRSTDSPTSIEERSQWWRSFFSKQNTNDRIKPHELTFLLSNLSTLIENGVALPKAIGTLAQEDTMAKHRDVLDALRRKIESGVAFSTALSQYKHICDQLTINQIRLGERSGRLAETLKKLSANRNRSSELRRQVIQKLAYPALLIVMGSGLITFLLMYVVPVFQETYDNAGVPLPTITRLLIEVGVVVQSYGWAVIVGGFFTVSAVIQLRRRELFALRMDRILLRLPIFGYWLRDIAVLQLMEVLQNLMEAGYTLAEALKETANSVGNRAVRQGVHELQIAVERGERFSRELERHDGMFPPVVSQLVLVGESTGQLTHAANDICDYLRREIERRTTLLVGALEPILTIGLAAAVAVILLAIYLPMFDMVNTMG